MKTLLDEFKPTEETNIENKYCEKCGEEVYETDEYEGHMKIILYRCRDEHDYTEKCSNQFTCDNVSYTYLTEKERDNKFKK